MNAKALLTALWDRAVAVLLVLVAAVLLVIGWNRVSDTPFPAEQLPYLMSAGVGGLFLLGLGATLWLSADLRDEWHKLDAIDQRLERLERPAETVPPLPAQEPATAAAPTAGRRTRRTVESAEP